MGKKKMLAFIRLNFNEYVYLGQSQGNELDIFRNICYVSFW